MVPTTGVDIVKLLNQMYSDLNTAERKSLKAFNNLVLVMQQLGGNGSNSLCAQYTVRALELGATEDKKTYKADKLYIYLESLKEVRDLGTLVSSSLNYLNQKLYMQETHWLAKLYTRLIKLPLSNPVTVVIFALLNAHKTFLVVQRGSHLQLLVHLM